MYLLCMRGWVSKDGKIRFIARNWICSARCIWGCYSISMHREAEVPGAQHISLAPILSHRTAPYPGLEWWDPVGAEGAWMSSLLRVALQKWGQCGFPYLVCLGSFFLSQIGSHLFASDWQSSAAVPEGWIQLCPCGLLGQGALSSCPISECLVSHSGWDLCLFLKEEGGDTLRLLAMRPKSTRTRVVRVAEDSLHLTGMTFVIRQMLTFMLRQMLSPADKYAAWEVI